MFSCYIRRFFELDMALENVDESNQTEFPTMLFE